jgi:hypothetical protein
MTTRGINSKSGELSSSKSFKKPLTRIFFGWAGTAGSVQLLGQVGKMGKVRMVWFPASWRK